jgi:hypothetical protein
MAKSRKNRSLSLKSVNKGLTTVGSVAKGVAKQSVPVIEKGVSAVYGTMATGFNLGVKGVKTVAKGVKTVTKKRRTRRHKKSRRH